jgi:hypothetical protein
MIDEPNVAEGSRHTPTMNASIFDSETSELLELGATRYREIALAERAVHRAQSGNYGHLRADDYRRMYELTKDLEALQDAARSAFAGPLGFVSGKPFTLDELRAGAAAGLAEEDPGCAFMGKGRADYFYQGGKPIAVVGHSRARWSDCHEFGVTNGLDATALPGSWVSPGVFIATLYTLPGFVHLPKQRVPS